MTHLRITLFAGLLATLLAACLGPKNRAFANIMDGNQLYSLCTNTDVVSNMMCMSYLNWISDTVDRQTIFGSKSCQPKGNLTLQQLKDVVVAWLREKPQYRHAESPSLVAAALAEAFPCKN